MLWRCHFFTVIFYPQTPNRSPIQIRQEIFQAGGEDLRVLGIDRVEHKPVGVGRFQVHAELGHGNVGYLELRRLDAAAPGDLDFDLVLPGA